MYMESTVFTLARRTHAVPRAVVTAVALVLLGYGIVTVAERPYQMRTGVEGPAVMEKAAVVELSTLPANEQEGARADGVSQADPRECDLARGISSACVFE